MISQQNQNDAESLENLYLNFASATIEKINGHIHDLGGVPIREFKRIEFVGLHSWTTQSEFITDFGSLVFKNSSIAIETKESDLCARKHWEAGILQLRQITDNEGNPLSLTYEESKTYIVQALLAPFLETIYKAISSYPIIFSHYKEIFVLTP